MPTPFTRFLDKAGGYTRHDEQQITFDQTGCDALRTMIDTMRDQNHKQPRALSASHYAGDENTKTNWKYAGALPIEFYVGDDLTTDTENILQAAAQLGVAHFILDTCARDYRRTLTLMLCFSAPIADPGRYARLVFVYADRLKALGLKMKLDHTSSAMTHLVHIHPLSDAVFVPGALPLPRDVIKQSAAEAKNLDLTRFDTIGARAAEAQLAPPTLTSSDNLFEWPAS